MDSALQVAEEEVVVAAESCGPSSKFEDIYRLLAEGCFPPSFCSIKRKNLKRYAQKFVVDGGEPGGPAGQPGGGLPGRAQAAAAGARTGEGGRGTRSGGRGPAGGKAKAPRTPGEGCAFPRHGEGMGLPGPLRGAGRGMRPCWSPLPAPWHL